MPPVGQRQTTPAVHDTIVGKRRRRIGHHRLFHIGPPTASRDIDFSQIGHINHRRLTHVVLHQSDVDREFVVAPDEFDRAVERIDQPEQLPVAALLVTHFAPFFRKDRNARRSQRFLDDPVRRAVGDRNGGFVVLDAYVVVFAVLVDLHYGCPGTYCRIENARQQILSHFVANHRLPTFRVRHRFSEGKGNKNS